MSLEIDLSGRAVIVTGGGKGVGRGITERFLAAGADVVICGRREPGELPSADGREAVFVACDVREPEQIDTVVAAAIERFGRLDVLVNNAGGAPYVDAATASPRFTEKIVALNLLAPINFSQKANAAMQHQDDGGVIINISSVSGVRPSPGTTAYGAAKAGLISATKSLAIEWAPKVRLAAIIGGLIRTEQAHLHYGDEAAIARVSQNVPLGRLARPSEIGDVCVFLASPMASYVSGATIDVHGGGEPPPHLDAAKDD